MKKVRKFSVSLVCLLLLITGCTSNNKIDNNNTNNNSIIDNNQQTNNNNENNQDENNKDENNKDENEIESTVEETLEINSSNKGHTLGSSIGIFVVDKDGSVYYQNYETINYMDIETKLTSNDLSILGTKKEYTNYTYQSDPMCDLEKGCIIKAYKLNLTNVKSAYEVMYGNGGSSGGIIFVTYDGKVHSLNFNLSSDNKISLNQNISKHPNIVSVVQNMQFDGHSAILIDNNGNKYNVVETNNTNIEGKKGHTLNSIIGNFIIDKDGSVYYQNYNTISYMGTETELTSTHLSNLGTKKEYTNYTYQSDPTCDLEKGCTIEAYKLNLINVNSAYEVIYGNGSISGGIIFLTNDGKVHTLYYNLSNNQKLVLKQDISQYPNIVSAVKNVQFAHSVKLIDKDGNMYDMYIY